jgi:hypothetical protein
MLQVTRTQLDKVKELQEHGWIVHAAHPVPGSPHGLIGGPTPIESPDGRRWSVDPNGVVTPTPDTDEEGNP